MRRGMLRMGAVVLGLAVAAAGTAEAKVFSKKTARVYQVRIVQGMSGQDVPKAAPWEPYTRYLGPGDVIYLKALDIYLSHRGDVAAVRVIRQSYATDRTVTSLFTGVLEVSIETLPEGSSPLGQDVVITVRSIDELALP